jgi:endonuclease I
MFIYIYMRGSFPKIPLFRAIANTMRQWGRRQRERERERERAKRLASEGIIS